MLMRRRTRASSLAAVLAADGSRYPGRGEIHHPRCVANLLD